MLISRRVASSRTETCFGTTTGGRPSTTATAGAACSTGAMTGCGRCGLRPRGRGPRCGGNLRGRAFGNYAVSFCRTRAASVSSTFNRSAVTASTGISSAFASAPSESVFRHALPGRDTRPVPVICLGIYRKSPLGDLNDNARAPRFARGVAATHEPLRQMPSGEARVPFGLPAFLFFWLPGSIDLFVHLLFVPPSLDLCSTSPLEVVTWFGVLLAGATSTRWLPLRSGSVSSSALTSTRLRISMLHPSASRPTRVLAFLADRERKLRPHDNIGGLFVAGPRGRTCAARGVR